MVGRNKEQKHNSRYKRNHDLLIASIRKHTKTYRARITVNQVVEDVGMARSSFYNHYPDVNSAIEASDAVLVKRFARFLEKPPLVYKKPSQNPNRYYYELTFLYMGRNKVIFRRVCDDINNQSLLYKMVETVYPRLQITWPTDNGRLPAIGSERVDMFLRMVVEVISRWGKETRCEYEAATPYINRLSVITAEAGMRCR